MSSGIFSSLSGSEVVFIAGLVLAASVLIAFLSVRTFQRYKSHTGYKNAQYGALVPAQFNGKSSKADRDEAFARRLDQLAVSEENYELEQLLPRARELGAIANTTFSTAPVLDASSAGVLALIESAVSDLKCGCRVLMHTSLETLVNLNNEGARTLTTKLSMTGIEIKFAIVDKFGKLVMAIDHQGFNKKNRQDHINRSIMIEVLRKAGVWYLEIPQHYSEHDARGQIISVLHNKTGAGAGEEVA